MPSGSCGPARFSAPSVRWDWPCGGRMLRRHQLLHAEDVQGHPQMTQSHRLSFCQTKIEDPDGPVRDAIRGRPGDGERKQVSLHRPHWPDLNPGQQPSVWLPGGSIPRTCSSRGGKQAGSADPRGGGEPAATWAPALDVAPPEKPCASVSLVRLHGAYVL